MENYKIIISSVAVILMIFAYVPYIRDIFKNKTKPHAFSFFIWGSASFLIYALQVKGGAGVGSWVTLGVSLISIFIFVLALRFGEKNITKSDILFLALALISLFLWVIVKQPVWSIILIVLVDILGFAPTIRKSWNKPHSETLFLYQMSALRHGLAIFSLEKFNILTLLNPVTWTLANGLFAILLIVRRKKLDQNLKDIKFTALFVKDKQDLLKRFPPKHKKVFADHSTIEFKPKNLDGIEIGRESSIKIIGRAYDQFGDDLLVENPKSKNEYPHITLSRGENAPSLYSRELFKKAIESNTIEYFTDEQVVVIEGYSDGKEYFIKPI